MANMLSMAVSPNTLFNVLTNNLVRMYLNIDSQEFLIFSNTYLQIINCCAITVKLYKLCIQRIKLNKTKHQTTRSSTYGGRRGETFGITVQ